MTCHLSYREWVYHTLCFLMLLLRVLFVRGEKDKILHDMLSASVMDFLGIYAYAM
jgi:hypothetical protein